jgi:hypothetical protein
MTAERRAIRLGRALGVFVAIAFGIVTVIAGGRVLSGTDPGYLVFRPLLVFNTAMGVAYIVAGAVTWRDLGKGRAAAAAIFAVNLVVLVGVVVLYRTGGPVAMDSVMAMTLRTAVWAALFGGLTWLMRAERPG